MRPSARPPPACREGGGTRRDEEGRTCAPPSTPYAPPPPHQTCLFQPFPEALLNLHLYASTHFPCPLPPHFAVPCTLHVHHTPPPLPHMPT